MLLIWAVLSVCVYSVSCEVAPDNDPILVAASGWLPPNEPRYVLNRTCNAYRLYALDSTRHYDHFQNERCGRHVSHLIVQRSIVRFIPSNFFIHKASFENLTTLKMDNVSLRTIYPENFQNISHLELLSLTWNRQVHVPANIFFFLPELQEANLSFNFISTMDAKAFSDASRLKTLRLNGNQLATVDSNWFLPLTSLNLLDLGSNVLEGDLNGDFFKFTTDLKLVLRRNQLSNIYNFSSEPNQTRFRLLDFSENPLEFHPIIVGSRSMNIIY